ncbi:PREDICTED: taste receptor type 2 member 16-like [Elephantulus edwardii]|uniref:taste receptor type 2 member 16-like n=1 Tax=Elephantulus edwardii TaxID=28737 RepID=UPI0003F0909A|nr:PREDICTED: taste receptor type 2 member 16-like [Elephantulus edwardii]
MMPMQLTVFFMLLYVLLSLTIVVQSTFIVAVLGREWVKVKRLSPLDMILISLGVSKLCLQCISIFYNFYSYFDYNYICLRVGTTWHVVNTAIFWFNSLLAVFYCVKVSSFTHPIFLWLKWRISRLVPWMLLGTLLISCMVCIPSTIQDHLWFQLNVKSFTANSTMLERLSVFQQYAGIPHQIVMLMIPFLLFLASIIMLIASLLQHWRQMKHHSPGHSSKDVHFAALKSLAIFLIFFSSYFLTVFISIIGYLFEKQSWFWIWEAVIYAGSCVHSTSLTLSSPTLRKYLKKMC